LAADRQPNEKGALRKERAFFIAIVFATPQVIVGASLLAPTGFACIDRVLQAKKRATEVAQNALRAHYIQKEPRLFPLVRILPDKKSEPCKKHKHEADSQHSGDHHVVEKHDASPALALLR
jgi:hypothetical protein